MNIYKGIIVGPVYEGAVVASVVENSPAAIACNNLNKAKTKRKTFQ